MYKVLKNKKTGKYLSRGRLPVATTGDSIGAFDETAYEITEVNRLPGADELEQEPPSVKERALALIAELSTAEKIQHAPTLAAIKVFTDMNDFDVIESLIKGISEAGVESLDPIVVEISKRRAKGKSNAFRLSP